MQMKIYIFDNENIKKYLFWKMEWYSFIMKFPISEL